MKNRGNIFFFSVLSTQKITFEARIYCLIEPYAVFFFFFTKDCVCVFFFFATQIVFVFLVQVIFDSEKPSDLHTYTETGWFLDQTFQPF
jgi:hypothetical protein